MKLSLSILAWHLARNHELNHHQAGPLEQTFGRPRYYEGPASKPGFLYLLPESLQESLLPGNYICFCPPRVRKSRETSWICILDDTSPEGLYNEIQAIFDLYDGWELDSLTSVEKFQDYRSLIQLVWSTFQIPAVLLDNRYNIIATAHADQSDFSIFERDDSLPSEVLADFVSNPRFRNLEHAEGIIPLDMDQSYLICNFRFGGSYCGRLIMGIRDQDLLSRNRLILERLSDFVEILLHRFGALQMAASAQTYLHSFFADALDEKFIGESDLKHLQDTSGWSADHRYLLAVFLPEHRLKKELYPPYLIRQIEERWRHTCAIDYHGNVAMLLNVTLQRGTSSLTQFYQSLAYLVRDGLMIAGCSRTFQGLRELSIYFRQTQYAIEFGQKKDSTRWYFRFEDYSLDYLIKYGVGSFKAEQVCHPALLLLREHDRDKQTSYYETLSVFFSERFNMSQTAARLFIHRSTLISRMERIEELTHLDVNDYDTRLYLEISFRLLEASH